MDHYSVTLFSESVSTPMLRKLQVCITILYTPFESVNTPVLRKLQFNKHEVDNPYRSQIR